MYNCVFVWAPVHLLGMCLRILWLYPFIGASKIRRRPRLSQVYSKQSAYTLLTHFAVYFESSQIHFAHTSLYIMYEMPSKNQTYCQPQWNISENSGANETGNLIILTFLVVCFETDNLWYSFFNLVSYSFKSIKRSRMDDKSTYFCGIE